MGQLVIAAIDDHLTDHNYCATATVRTGDHSGKRIAVYSRLQGLEGKLLLHLDAPQDPIPVPGISLAGYFVTADIPQTFQCAEDNDAVLYAPWTKTMKWKYRYPINAAIAKYYRPCELEDVLYFSRSENKVLARRLKGRTKNFRRGKMTAEAALREYLRDTLKYSHSPIVVAESRIIDTVGRMLARCGKMPIRMHTWQRYSPQSA